MRVYRCWSCHKGLGTDVEAGRICKYCGGLRWIQIYRVSGLETIEIYNDSGKRVLAICPESPKWVIAWAWIIVKLGLGRRTHGEREDRSHNEGLC